MMGRLLALVALIRVLAACGDDVNSGHRATATPTAAPTATPVPAS
jgi:hypothetical protein